MLVLRRRGRGGEVAGGADTLLRLFCDVDEVTVFVNEANGYLTIAVGKGIVFRKRAPASHGISYQSHSVSSNCVHVAPPYFALKKVFKSDCSHHSRKGASRLLLLFLLLTLLLPTPAENGASEMSR